VKGGGQAYNFFCNPREVAGSKEAESTQGRRGPEKRNSRAKWRDLGGEKFTGFAVRGRVKKKGQKKGEGFRSDTKKL